jgi:hypothetical protein
MTHYFLLKGHDIAQFYYKTVRFYYQYRILYFSNFYEVNKKNENTSILTQLFITLLLYLE